MEYIVEREKKTPVSDACDVLVAGGGFAGAAAALAAARQGKRVILCEREFMLGGLGTIGLVVIYLPICDGMGNQVSFGIAEELLRLGAKHGTEHHFPTAWLNGGTKEERVEQRFRVRYNPWLFATDLEQLLVKEGVEILYGTLVCDLSMEDRKITSVVVENKSGRSAIRVKSCVDATGDADLCALAGAKTALFAPKNVVSSWYYFVSPDELKLKALSCHDFFDTGKESCPLSPMRISGVDAKELSDYMIESRRVMKENVLAYRKEQNEKMEPVCISTIPEMRMTRRIVGKTELTLSSDHVFVPTSVGCFGNWRKKGPAYETPFECLYGPEVKNLITAGRCLSATDEMWDITRVIPVCSVTGEAAGVAAALSDDFESLDIRVLQKALEEKGVVLHL